MDIMATCCAINGKGQRCQEPATHWTPKNRYCFCEVHREQWARDGIILAWMSVEARAETGYSASTIMVNFTSETGSNQLSGVSPSPVAEEEASKEEDAPKRNDDEGYYVTPQIVKEILAGATEEVRTQVEQYKFILGDQPVVLEELLKELYVTEGKQKKRKGVAELLKAARIELKEKEEEEEGEEEEEQSEE